MPKSGKKKKGKTKKLPGNATPEAVVKRLLKTYDRNCLLTQSHVCCGLLNSLKDCVENNTLLSNFVLISEPVKSADEPLVALEPLLTAIRQERYVYINNLYVWNVILQHDQTASLALLLEKGIYPLKKIELMDCLIDHYAVQRLSLSFNACPTLTHIILDYNEFGDEGCRGLCVGLQTTATIIHVSLCYCGLGVESGLILGHMISSSAVRELYLDGNDLQCEGAVELIKLCADHAERETYEKEAARVKEEEDSLREREGFSYTSQSDDGRSRSESAAKSKKKKGKKSKEPPAPPRVGPWIHKLHLADNGIDALGDQSTFAPLVCMRLLRRLIAHSECLEELDLDDNLIGDLGGREVMEALLDRKEAGLPGAKVRTTHRMCTETFENIIKLATGLKKEKKRGGKKKKKK